MSSFDIVAADAIEPARLHAAFAAAFADYLIGPFRMQLAEWPPFLARQGVELPLSRVAVAGGDTIAFCFVAPRPDCASWRLGTMGALPAARGSGAAPALLQDFTARAKAAGVNTVELECFAQNTRALRLYDKHGFTTIDALYGYRRDSGHDDPPSAIPRVIEMETAFAWLEACREAGIALPLQVTPRSLRALPVQLQAWRQGEAQLVFSPAADGGVQVHSLVDRAPAQQDAEQLLAALLSIHPGRPLNVPQLQRHAVGGAALERLGFERLPLHQVWMTASV
ncbi:MAG: family N-acetyltransferase [Ramlibacter sp.]|jgi:GNAT superfamily N-acetyltransferase|nr:family N-acetyltransferase [Ramlibacter sp.]